MNIYDELKKIKTDQTAVVFKDYFSSDITWEQVLEFLYTNASIVAKVTQQENNRRMEAKKLGTEIYGDVYVSPHSGSNHKLVMCGIKFLN